MDRTIDLLRPYQSTRDLDGIRTDREDVQDIAYDGDECGYRDGTRARSASATHQDPACGRPRCEI